jgi:hypothetical protein
MMIFFSKQMMVAGLVLRFSPNDSIVAQQLSEGFIHLKSHPLQE